MPIFTHPQSFRDADSPSFCSLGLPGLPDTLSPTFQHQFPMSSMSQSIEALPSHSSHPNFAHLALLVFEAVLEVVCVCLPGYIMARTGVLRPDMQKFIAEMNIMLFTPCLIFTKLASQLTADKLVDLAVIPVIFLIQVGISYVCALATAKAFKFEKRARNFVVAMGVFGNSNSLPISLVLSLSRTIQGLHWDKIPGDNDNEVGARGILYLLIFQQLGQLLRWSWGINVLLPKPTEVILENGHSHHRPDNSETIDSQVIYDENELPSNATSKTADNSEVNREESLLAGDNDRASNDSRNAVNAASDSPLDSDEETPLTSRQYTSSASSRRTTNSGKGRLTLSDPFIIPPANGNIMPPDCNGFGKSASGSAPNLGSVNSSDAPETSDKSPSFISRGKTSLVQGFSRLSRYISSRAKSCFAACPPSLQKAMMKVHKGLQALFRGIWQSLNPPLIAMAVAIIVASIPSLQRLFFNQGSFVQNSVTSAIKQTGGVAVPLILLVLGANLARGSGSVAPGKSPNDEDKIETRLVIASLLSRLVLPTLLMTPLLAIAAKYIPVSILDDPIFVIVCFLLAGAPSALQLAQICQLNDVYMGAMTRILFHSYVTWILPTTLILVLCALEVVEWAAI